LYPIKSSPKNLKLKYKKIMTDFLKLKIPSLLAIGIIFLLLLVVSSYLFWKYLPLEKTFFGILGRKRRNDASGR